MPSYKKVTLDAYARAGVNIDAGNEAVRLIKRHVHSARTSQVLADVGSFGGLFALPAGYRQPVLVASTDGVGTKLLIAARMQRFDTVGQDLVNHCVNDILVQGAKALFFLDYVATGNLQPSMIAEIVRGLATACRENGCALLGGETAEMPGLYRANDFDLAGTIVGLVEKKKIVDGSRIRPGDIILGLASTGLHTNGYSLARHIIFKKQRIRLDHYVPEFRRTMGEELLQVHRSYARVVFPLLAHGWIRGLAHITGGGLVENIPRILPPNCQAEIQPGSWPILPIFNFLQKVGKVSEETFYRTFNTGIGMVIVVRSHQVGDVQRVMAKAGEKIYTIGRIVPGKASVRFSHSRS
jgi:phosphoribosylformylglycinamidine cyclo-ligase